MPYGLYIHIPYCRSRCHYCDFYTAGGNTAVPDVFVDALLRGWRRYAKRQEGGALLQPDTVYFGGGTPGLLNAAQVARIVQEVRPAGGAEITLETNPDLATPQALEGWREAGVNRLSLGVQTASDTSLRRLGRLHTAAHSRAALQAAKGAGFANVSGDIMLALPEYTKDEFDETLVLLQEGGAAHVSAYLLKIEPCTAFGKATPAGLPTEDEAADWYAYAAEELQKAGYARYELSNFAKPGRQSRHNLLYWNCEDVLGLGPGAHSLQNGKRFSFGGDVQAFLADKLSPRPQGEDTAEDYIMLRLRLDEGLDEDALYKRYGVGLTPHQLAVLARLEQAGYAKRQGAAWTLTGSGLMVENAILAELL